MNKTNVKANPSTTYRHDTPNNKTHIIKFRVTEKEKRELVGAKPLHLAVARPFCRLKAPLGLSLLRKRGLAHSKTPSSLPVHSHPPCAAQCKDRAHCCRCRRRRRNPDCRFYSACPVQQGGRQPEPTCTTLQFRRRRHRATAGETS